MRLCYKSFFNHLNFKMMKNTDLPKNNGSIHKNTIANRAHNDVRQEKKMNGITNAGGQRSDQTSNKDNERKRGQ